MVSWYLWYGKYDSDKDDNELARADSFKDVSVNSYDTTSLSWRLPGRRHDRYDRKEIRKVE